MRVNILQHTPEEGPGAIRIWAHARGHQVYVYHPAQHGKLPSAAETDLLVVLGGPISPNDDAPWIAAERYLMREVMVAHKPIFGACFGAQQIAKLLGATVSPAPVKEVGWAPVTRQADVIPGLPAQLKVLHWHQDMFALPDGATRLFASEQIQNQGLVVNDNVVGLQFHLEVTEDNVHAMVVNDGDYVADSVLHQTVQSIETTPVPDENRAAMFQILDYITRS
ncbi:type 1 glutamine amidotransferase [Levilactobacillus parabrevis]|uniref:type 1 glutamine amidotransferase n=1 Tax=Levilactobacillus parabrevis TaxID=357278 RepID=UPI0021A5B745|nr:type 1 glutamine amidotransferase [Levilactobacillus parabrevis]MCT4486826.1 type 1 glutamine amidotransferase [Levilactobacillus parabrevis]MCT4489251.1 type 1 glutamine amidotransferase [Levilactobacillus parabrevis]